MPSRIRIVSPDAAFAGSIGSRLASWGLSVSCESDFGRITAPRVEDEQVDVILLDVRRPEGGVLGWLSALKGALPALEVILLGLAGQVGVSIEGMRAGASHELSVPLDTAALRRAVSDALRRRHKQLPVARPSLLERFQRAMAAATFAQAGEFETARQMLEEDGPPPRRRGPKGS